MTRRANGLQKREQQKYRLRGGSLLCKLLQGGQWAQSGEKEDLGSQIIKDGRW